MLGEDPFIGYRRLPRRVVHIKVNYQGIQVSFASARLLDYINIRLRYLGIITKMCATRAPSVRGCSRYARTHVPTSVPVDIHEMRATIIDLL